MFRLVLCTTDSAVSFRPFCKKEGEGQPQPQLFIGEIQFRQALNPVQPVEEGGAVDKQGGSGGGGAEPLPDIHLQCGVEAAVVPAVI